MPFLYKGYNVNTIISSGNSSVPTTSYKGFPSYNPSNANVDLDKVKNPLLYQISTSDIVSNSNIQAASYKSPSSTSGTYNVPDWCKGVKFYISSMQGSKGSQGSQGDKGSQGAQGAQGNSGTAKNCMTTQATRNRPGGPGGPGGEGGPGGYGGPGGEGGQGVYLYRTELIPVTGGESHTYSNNVSGATTLKISNAYSFTTNNGNNGGQGGQGGKGNAGGQGGQGNSGSGNCPNGDHGNTGNTGSAGSQGNVGNTGAAGTAGNYSATNNTSIATGSSNTSEITVYFFTT